MAAIVTVCRAVREPAATGRYHSTTGGSPVHVIHGTDGAGVPDVADYRGAPRQPRRVPASVSWPPVMIRRLRLED